MVLALALAVVLVAYSSVTNRAPSRESTYLARNVAAGLVLVLVARVAGLSWSELGLGATALGSGWRWAGLGLLVVVVGVVLTGVAATVAPRVRRAVADPRADLPAGRLWFQVLVRIPVGTAAFEELAFRGVLLAAFAQSLPTAGAVAAQAVAFGLWHVGPTRLTLRSGGARSGAREGVVVAVAVGATTAAGVALALLRLVADSLLAPVVVHAAVNGLGLLLASFVRQRHSG